ncbi:DMT family transporter [Defluviimonas sp. SAOS-178_SWC]|uniref:DMT family transporter n=1 Tax=Defluviimonas sp. SAOS-178_SWC TaxID=3121287 RepID=UPI0032216546
MQSHRPADLFAAFATGGLLTLMVLFNGQFAANGTALFASWAAHGTGMIAALVFLALVPRLRGTGPRMTAPLWSYLGGLSGAATVMLTSTTVNSALALSGTLALGLAGQIAFGLMADRFGYFGLARRRIAPRDLAALALILAGSGLIIFGRGG